MLRSCGSFPSDYCHVHICESRLVVHRIIDVVSLLPSQVIIWALSRRGQSMNTFLVRLHVLFEACLDLEEMRPCGDVTLESLKNPSLVRYLIRILVFIGVLA